jgi:hypothetical protein
MRPDTHNLSRIAHCCNPHPLCGSEKTTVTGSKSGSANILSRLLPVAWLTKSLIPGQVAAAATVHDRRNVIGLPLAVLGSASCTLSIVALVEFLANGAHVAFHHKKLGHCGLLALPSAPPALPAAQWALAIRTTAFIPRREHAVDGDAFVIPHRLLT